MRALMGDNTLSKDRPWHSIQRVLCWDANGPPPRHGGQPARGMLLVGKEGHNLACHAGCRVEKAHCLCTHHLQWGTAAMNAEQARDSKAAYKQGKVDSLRGRD